MRVLLIEDDTLLQEVLVEALEGHGCEVYPARSCAEAAVVAREWPPDAVVADLHGTGDLADVAGLGLPLILSSGSGESYLAAATLRLGAAAALHKPYDPPALMAALDCLRPTAA